MKQWLLGSLMIGMILLAACAPRIYGIPQERWETMSEQERVAAMEAYTARQEVLRQQREEQARQRAMEKQAQLAREAEENRRRQLQIDAIYRGEGLYGDLLRVNLEGGMLQFYGDHKPYHPVSFKIAASETKKVEIVSNRGHKSFLTAHYDGSNLLLDETSNSSRQTALRLPYDDAWEAGTTYTNRFAKGPREMRGVNVTVRIVGEPPRGHHGRRHRPKVIVVQPPAQQPLPEDVHYPKRPPAKKPDIIVINPQLEETHNPAQIATRRPHEKNHDAGPPERIEVVFRNGFLKLKNRRHPIAAQAIDLSEGDVRTVRINSNNGSLKIKISYLNGQLLIDDAPGRGKKHTRLGYVPGWKNGQQYIIGASSNRRMEDLDVLIVSR